jgi:hypothetical protein
MLHVCYVLGCPVGKYGSNCENNCTCPDNAQDGCEKNSGNCTCILGKTGENCKEGKQCYIEYPIIRRNTNDREIYRDFVLKAKWKDFLNEVSEVC